MRILITTGIYPPEIGGPATYTKLLEENLRTSGVDVRILPFRIVRFLPRGIRHFIFFLYVLAYARGRDVVYAQDPVSVGFPSVCAAKIMGKKFIIRVAGDYAWEQSRQRFGLKSSIDEFQLGKYDFRTEFIRRIQKFVVRRADKIITPSLYFKNLVVGWTSNSLDVKTIYNGIDVSELLTLSEEIEKRTIISAGRLVPWKGFEMLIEIMSDLPDFKLYIAGSGPDEKRLKSLAREKKVSQRVFFLGQLTRKDLMEKIAKCEIFALNTSFESFSFQVVEAMYVGTPVIATYSGSIPEIIKDGETGFLIDPNDRSKFLECVKILSEDKVFRNKIIEAGKKRSEDFSIQRTVSQTVEVIQDLIK